MATKLFEISLSGTVTVEIDDQVIEAVNDDWRATFYKLRTPEEIAGHIAYNLVVNRVKLSQMDGWADQPDSNVKVVNEEWETE